MDDVGSNASSLSTALRGLLKVSYTVGCGVHEDQTEQQIADPLPLKTWMNPMKFQLQSNNFMDTAAETASYFNSRSMWSFDFKLHIAIVSIELMYLVQISNE